MWTTRHGTVETALVEASEEEKKVALYLGVADRVPLHRLGIRADLDIEVGWHVEEVAVARDRGAVPPEQIGSPPVKVVHRPHLVQVHLEVAQPYDGRGGDGGSGKQNSPISFKHTLR